MAYVRPTSATANGWSNADNAYNNNTSNGATISLGGNAWTPYLVMHLENAISCNEIGVYDAHHGNINIVEVDVYNGSTWTNVYDGDPGHGGWVTASFTAINNVESIRTRCYRPSGGGNRTCSVNDTRLGVEPDSIEGTAKGSGSGSATAEGITVKSDTASGSAIGSAQVANPLNIVLSMPYGSGAGGAYPDSEVDVSATASGSGIGTISATGYLVREGTCAGTGTGSGTGSGIPVIETTASSSGNGSGTVDQVEFTMVDSGSGSGLGTGTTNGYKIHLEGVAGSGSGIFTASGARYPTDPPPNFELTAFNTAPFNFGHFNRGGPYAMMVTDGYATGEGRGTASVVSSVEKEEMASGSGVGTYNLTVVVEVEEQTSSSGTGTMTVTEEIDVSVQLQASGIGTATVIEEIEVEESASGSGTGTCSVTDEVIAETTADGSGVGTSTLVPITLTIEEDAFGSGVGSAIVYDEGFVDAVADGSGSGSGVVTITEVETEQSFDGSGIGTGTTTSEVGVEEDASGSGIGTGASSSDTLGVVEGTAHGSGWGYQRIFIGNYAFASGIGTTYTVISVVYFPYAPRGSGVGRSSVFHVRVVDGFVEGSGSGTGSAERAAEVIEGTSRGYRERSVTAFNTIPFNFGHFERGVVIERSPHGQGTGIQENSEVYTGAPGSGSGVGTGKVEMTIYGRGVGTGEATGSALTVGHPAGSGLGSGLAYWHDLFRASGIGSVDTKASLVEVLNEGQASGIGSGEAESWVGVIHPAGGSGVGRGKTLGTWKTIFAVGLFSGIGRGLTRPEDVWRAAIQGIVRRTRTVTAFGKKKTTLQTSIKGPKQIHIQQKATGQVTGKTKKNVVEGRVKK